LITQAAEDVTLKAMAFEPDIILAAVLVRARALRDSGADEVSFCELDGDLQPWDKYGRRNPQLAALYDSAGIWVYGDFAMENPARRRTFPEE
jgi:hypothetical protein